MVLGLTTLSLLILLVGQQVDSSQTLRLNELEDFESHGLNVLVHAANDLLTVH